MLINSQEDLVEIFPEIQTVLYDSVIVYEKLTDEHYFMPLTGEFKTYEEVEEEMLHRLSLGYSMWIASDEILQYLPNMA